MENQSIMTWNSGKRASPPVHRWAVAVGGHKEHTVFERGRLHDTDAAVSGRSCSSHGVGAVQQSPPATAVRSGARPSSAQAILANGMARSKQAMEECCQMRSRAAL